MNRSAPSLAIVVPCYNEEEIIQSTFERLEALLKDLIEKKKVTVDSHIYFIDDGSDDKTWSILAEFAEQSAHAVALRLSRNKGHQNAVYAGLCLSDEDAVVSIDADLQDDVEAIKKMVDAYLSGDDVVFGVRSQRSTDTFFKRYSAESYYKLMRLMGVDLVFNHADFRLLSRRAIDSLEEYPETNIFLRGLVREMGYPSSVVSYERTARAAGESKYPLWKMLSFAWDGITSFSSVPLRLITVIGALSSCISVLVMMWVLFVWFFYEEAVPGWASILMPLLFIGSIQLLFLGVVGEYIAKIYKETKRRPKFHVSESVGK